MPSDEEIGAAVAALLGHVPSQIERLRGGRNNVVAATHVDGRKLVAKLYFTHPDDPRDRAGAEFGFVSLLWAHGVRCIPEPVAHDPAAGIAVFGHIEGDRLRPGDVGWDEVAQLVAHLSALRRLTGVEAARGLPDASEAHFSVASFVAAMTARLARLRAALADTETGQGVALRFVERELVPAATVVCEQLERTCKAIGLGSDEVLAPPDRTLSPADFGFHNALRGADGRLTFLDFEYAGWDDPATVLAQGCLAPAVPLPRALHGRFLNHLGPLLGDTVAITSRLRAIYPLVALKWCMVALNEALSVSRERRAFAGAEADSSSAAEQVALARRLLREAVLPSAPIAGR